MVNNGMAIPLPSHLGSILYFFPSCFFWPLYSWLLDCKLLVKQLFCFCWHRGVPSFVGVMLGTPRLRCYTILCVAFPLIAVMN